MKIVSIIGTEKKGNTNAILQLFLQELKDKNTVIDEIVLPKDLPHFCHGCASCILKGEQYCPHYHLLDPMIKKMVEADIIILATPIYVMSCSSPLKTFLDHLAYLWMVHRPNEKMFHKTGLIITTAGGSGVKATIKLLENNMAYWGISNIYHYGVTTLAMGGNYAECKKQDKIKLQVKKKANIIKSKINNNKVSIKTKILYHIFKMTQIKGWNKTDSDYWRKKGWLEKKRPY